jgi:hypothetical protein
MKFLCGWLGHKWNLDKWWKVAGDRSWHVADFCERCHERRYQSTQIQPLSDIREI